MSERVPANKKWFKEAVLEEAKKFKRKIDWQIGSRGSYLAAIKNVKK